MSDSEKENGTGDVVVEEAAAEEAQASSMDTAKKTFDDAIKQVEKRVGDLSKALGNALQDRGNVVMVRVNDDSLHYLDMLVEADITKSRSESAAFLINEGIKANEALFNKIREITDQIGALKAQLRETVNVAEE